MSLNTKPPLGASAMTNTLPKKMKKHIIILSLAAVMMFGFGFALVPLYNVFCQVTGVNGKTQTNDIILSPIPIDDKRMLTVELLASTNSNIPATFVTHRPKYQFHPGEFIETYFWVENLSDKDLVIQAIPSVAPGLAGTYVKKQVCFCFQNQEIGAHQKMKMPLRFTVDPNLPEKYSTITLAYTIFDVTPREPQNGRKI